MTTMKLEAPAPLDNTKLHTRSEYKAWQAANFAYHASVRAEEQRAIAKAEAEVAAAAAKANRPMTDAEYDAQALERYEATQARLAELKAAEEAKQDAAAEYLASQPDVAVVDASNPYAFLKQAGHWFALGYSLPEDADITLLPTLYMVKLNKPVPTASTKKAK